ncbi:MAG: VIT domain-containing protein [Planctomycetota bacterium]|nr:VIT domain-containing protein [Planctomycetota bacterium]
MRQALLAVLLFLPVFQERAPAQGRDPVWRASHIVIPQRRSFSLRDDQPGIRIEQVDAVVKILGQAATTTLDIRLRNPGARQTEAVLLLPVPRKAVVHSFLFEGSAKEPTAKLMAKTEARRLYDSIVAKVRDPALLEFVGYNLIRSSVFPVPARGTQRIRLTYNHVLEADANRIDYVLPRSESLDVVVPWRIAVEIRTKSPISTVYSPSHELAVRRSGPGRMRVDVKEEGRIAPGPFRLSYLLERNGVSASLFAYPDPKVGGGYFMLLAGLPARISEKENPVKREVTLVIDRSGSMAGPKMDQVRAAALQVIESLADGEAFNIIDYSHVAELFAKKPVIKGPDTVEKARAYLQALRPTGGTNIHDAIVEALRQERVDAMLPIVLFLTDGLPTVGQTSEVAIREALEKGNPHRRRVFTFGVGDDVNVPLLDRLAELSRATSSYVAPRQDVEVKVAQVFKRLYGPVLADGELEILDDEGRISTRLVRELIPSTVPDLFEGDQLVLLGQYLGSGPLTFRLKGSYLGQPRTFTFSFPLGGATTRNAFVPRLWAARRIASLIDQIRQAGAAEAAPLALLKKKRVKDPRFGELIDEILRLSTEFGILSEYTSFLATEGTDLSDWKMLNDICGWEIDRKAVKVRSGKQAVARGKNVESAKRQRRLNYGNEYLDSDLKRVRIAGVRQVCDRTLFLRGGRWIDGQLIAANVALKPDRVVRFGTPEYRVLLDGLVREGRQATIAHRGEILLQYGGQKVLVQNTD